MSEKTEQPTPKKLRDARKKGQVAKSKEVVSASLIVMLFGLMTAFIGLFVKEISDMILAPGQFYGAEFGLALDAILSDVLDTALLVVVPIVATAAAVGVIAHLAQFGFLMSGEALMPKLSNLNPASGVKKIFNKKNLVEFLKSFVKITFLAVLLGMVIRNSIEDLTRIPYCGIECVPVLLGKLLFQVFIYTAAAFIIIAFADYIFQRWQFTEENKMTKDEVKREYKESEGDPHIKSHRRHMHQEMMQGDMDQAVRKSRVVVTNPVHLAVAIDYREGETPLPIIAAKGQRLIARRIVEIATAAGVPIIENIPVARGLYETGTLHQYVPSEMIDGIAAVLRAVRDLERERDQQLNG